MSSTPSEELDETIFGTLTPLSSVSPAMSPKSSPSPTAEEASSGRMRIPKISAFLPAGCTLVKVAESRGPTDVTFTNRDGSCLWAFYPSGVEMFQLTQRGRGAMDTDIVRPVSGRTTLDTHPYRRAHTKKQSSGIPWRFDVSFEGGLSWAVRNKAREWRRYVTVFSEAGGRVSSGSLYDAPGKVASWSIVGSSRRQSPTRSSMLPDSYPSSAAESTFLPSGSTSERDAW